MRSAAPTSTMAANASSSHLPGRGWRTVAPRVMCANARVGGNSAGLSAVAGKDVGHGCWFPVAMVLVEVGFHRAAAQRVQRFLRSLAVRVQRETGLERGDGLIGQTGAL